MKASDSDEFESLAADLRRALGTDSAGDTSIPGFSILNVLGEGGQGTVLQAVQLSTGRRVALKVLRKGRMATAQERMRFLREIRLASSLEHPDLVTVYEAGETDEGTPYLAMELVHGEPWDVWAERLREDVDEAVTTRILHAFAALSDAVGHAHERGVLHRDLKPSNVLVEEPDRPRVLDLGLAYSLDTEEPTDFRSRTSDFLGSLPWMPPERIRGVGTPVPASDVHALGLLLHCALTGRHAYAYGSSITDIVDGVESLPGSLAGPFSDDARLDRGCLAVLQKALERDPGARHEDAAELAAEIRELLAGRTLQRRRRPPRPLALAVPVGAIALVALAFVGARFLEDDSVEASTLAAVETVEDHGLIAWKVMFDETTTASGTGDWQVPGPDSSVLNHWRIAATHVFAKFPAERIDKLDPSRSWAALRGTGDGSLWLATDADGGSELVASEPGRTRTITVPGGPYDGAGLTGDGRWAVFYSHDEHELTALRVGADLELDQPRTLAASPFFSVADRHPWVALRTRDHEAVQVVDLDSGEVRVRIETDDPATHATFMHDDRDLWVRHLSGRWSTLDLEDPTSGLVDVPAARDAPQVVPLAGSQLYVRLGVDHFILDLETGDRRLLSAGNVAANAASLAEREIAWPVYHGIQRHRPARFSSALLDWVEAPAWTAPNLAGIEYLPTSKRLGLLRRTGEIITLDPTARGIPTMLSAGLHDETFHNVVSTEHGWLASRGDTLYLFRDGNTRAIEAFGPEDTIYEFDYDGRRKVYFTTKTGRVGVIDIAEPGPIEWLHQHSSFGSVVAVSPDRRWLASADSSGEVALLSLDGSSAPLIYPELMLPGDRVPDLAWDTDSHWVLGGRRRSKRLFWCGPDEAGFHVPDAGLREARAVVFHSADGTWLTGHESGNVAVWSAGAKSPNERHELAPGHSIWALDVSPDGRFLAVGAGREVAVWDWPAKRRLFASEAHDGLVFSLAFHHELPQLVSAAEHGELFLWDFARVDDLAQSRTER